jgi:hypothetical protein
MVLVRPLRHHTDQPVLITEARLSNDDEFDHRRNRYLLMMSIRAFCIIAAACTFRLSGWLAAAFIAGALVLPWTAVLLANDRPAKKTVQFRRFVNGVDPTAPSALTDGSASSEQTTEGKRSNHNPPHTKQSQPEPPKDSSVIDL